MTFKENYNRNYGPRPPWAGTACLCLPAPHLTWTAHPLPAWHTGVDPPSIAFWHLPPNSARSGYATEGALFISTQLSTDAAGQRPPKGLGTNKTVEAT